LLDLRGTAKASSSTEFKQAQKAISDAEFKQQMKAAHKMDEEEVNQHYSTKPVNVKLSLREYVVPANFLGPKRRDEPNTILAQKNGFGFVMFLPEFGGYTKENWRDPFDQRRIDVIQVNEVDKRLMVPHIDGSMRRITPASYGDSKARFEEHKKSLADAPAFRMYGLEGYRWKSQHLTGVTWVGARKNGEFFYFECSGEPNVAPRKDTNDLCQPRYYSEAEDLFVIYRYAQSNLSQWKEIDEAVWQNLRSWRVK
jgi:hypothetical protein